MMWGGKLLLSFGTVMFGIAFALSREAMSYLGPYSFNAIYSIVGCFILILCRTQLKKLKPDDVVPALPELEPFGSDYVRSIYPSIDPSTEQLVNLLIFSVPFGMLQFFANTLGQIGLVTIQVSKNVSSLQFLITNVVFYSLRICIQAGKSAFLTSLYVVFTPLLQSAFLDNSISKLNKWTWLSAIFSIFGSYLLAGCANAAVPSVGTGEVLTIFSAVIWAMSIIISDIGVKFIDGVDLVLASSIVSTIMYMYAACMMEPDTMMDLPNAVSGYGWQLVLWVSLLKTMGSVFGTVGQRHTSGYQAALIMGLDTVVTMTIGYFFLSERLNSLEKLGGFVLLMASFLTSVEDLLIKLKSSYLNNYGAYVQKVSVHRLL